MIRVKREMNAATYTRVLPSQKDAFTKLGFDVKRNSCDGGLYAELPGRAHFKERLKPALKKFDL